MSHMHQLKIEGMPFLLQRALKGARLKTIPSGQILFYVGDIARDVMVIKSGIVKLYDIDDEGSEKLLHLVKPPAVLPFAFFTSDTEAARWFYVSLTECEVFVLPPRELRAIMHANAEISDMLTAMFSLEVHEIMVRLGSMSKSSTQEKVIAALKFLMALHATEKRGGWWRVNFTISHQLIGDLCGITRESTSVAMKELQAKKIIRYPKVGILEINKTRLIE